MKQIQIDDVIIDVEQKNIKNIHLRVYLPNGKVKISAPLQVDLNTLRFFALSKLKWVKKQQAKILSQDRETPREFVNGENHYFNGKTYLLQIVEFNGAPRVELGQSELLIYVRPGTTRDKMEKILNEWYRDQLKKVLPAVIREWENRLNVEVNEFRVKKMKTRWGTCNPDAKRIWLNLELAKKPSEQLEYVVVHEMVHLLERKHNKTFIAYMDKYLSKWRLYKDELNRIR